MGDDRGAGDGDDEDVTATVAPAREAIDRKHLLMIIVPIISLIILNYIGTILAAALIRDNPLLLIAMSAPNRNLIAASHAPPLAAYFVIGTLRLLAPDGLFYALGNNYGDRFIAWMERRTPTYGVMMRQLEALFAKASWPLMVIIPNNPVCLLAGAARIDKRVFWTLNIVGTIGRLTLMWWIGDVFQEWVEAITGWISEHRLPIIAVSALAVGFTVAKEWRSGTNEIQEMIAIAEGEEDADVAVAKGAAHGKTHEAPADD